jgi:hypothetical protein
VRALAAALVALVAGCYDAHAVEPDGGAPDAAAVEPDGGVDGGVVCVAGGTEGGRVAATVPCGRQR